uniref:Secreted protein n=1 Tax=Ascaris lumbricoides TaxID=6252 RepID=A0A0M3HIQ5_ASCLU
MLNKNCHLRKAAWFVGCSIGKGCGNRQRAVTQVKSNFPLPREARHTEWMTPKYTTQCIASIPIDDSDI